MTGYYKNPEETNKAIDKEDWLHTGDMGYYNDYRKILVTGRYKDVIKSHSSVMEVAVVAIPHDIDVEQPIAFVKKFSDVSKSELVNLSLVRGDHKKLRGGVEFLDQLPKTPSGKINKPVFKEMVKALKHKRDFEHRTPESE